MKVAAEIAAIVGGGMVTYREPGLTVVAESRYAVVFPADIDFAAFPPTRPPISDASMQRMLKGLPDLAKAQPIDAARLREWATVPAKPECSRCKGSGEIQCKDCDSQGVLNCTCDCGDEHETECRGCRGRGGSTCPCVAAEAREREGLIGTFAVDRELVGKVLDLLPAEPTRYLVHDGPPKIHFVSGGVRAVLCGLSHAHDSAVPFDLSAGPA